MNRYAYSVWQYVVKKEYKIKHVYENEKFDKKPRRKDRRLSFYFRGEK